MDITTCDSWAIHLSRVRNFWYFWNFWPIWYFLLHVTPWCSDHEFYFITCFQMFAACAQSGCVPTRHFLSCSLQSPAERCWQQRVSAEELFEDGPGSPRQSMLSPRGRDGFNVWSLGAWLVAKRSWFRSLEVWGCYTPIIPPSYPNEYQ